jgi:hypothetical protein
MITYPNNTRNISFDGISTNFPVYKKPSPNANDYLNGYINRYFVKKINDNTIYEVDSVGYADVSNTLYTKSSLSWKITGRPKNSNDGKTVTDIGVISYNSYSISVLEKTIPGIRNILRNTVEFWRGY